MGTPGHRSEESHGITADVISQLDGVPASLSAEDVATVADIGRLDPLELHRLRYYEPDSPQRRALARVAIH
jgi:hypothetical protein